MLGNTDLEPSLRSLGLASKSAEQRLERLVLLCRCFGFDFRRDLAHQPMTKRGHNARLRSSSVGFAATTSSSVWFVRSRRIASAPTDDKAWERGPALFGL